MLPAEMYLQLRRTCLAAGVSLREASRVFGVDRDSANKMISNVAPQGYRPKRTPWKSKLEPHTGVIDAMLKSDQVLLRK